MKIWHGNFITCKTFKTKRSLGYDEFNISYSDEKTDSGIPKQLEILKGSKFYIYNLKEM